MMKTKRSFEDGDRYQYDNLLCRKGFAQIDTSQDAWYFGTWASPTELMIVSYTEGDVCIQTADSAEEFTAEIYKMKFWNEENGHSFLGIDPGFSDNLKAAFQGLGLGRLLH